MKLIRRWMGHQAVAGVIEALLMVALVAIVLSIIQLQYVPQIMEQREAEHMDTVSNQFSSLKSMIDLQAITETDAPMSTIITLGSQELPYFITMPSAGEIRVVDNEKWNMKIISNDTGIYVYDLTAIVYDAQNAYYVDQTYVLEGGGVFVAQGDSESVARVYPSMNTINGTMISVSFDLPIFRGVAGKSQTSGTGKSFIRTNYSVGDADTITDIYKINITTRYPDAWNETLHNFFENNVAYRLGDDYIEITKKSLKEIAMEVNYYYIYTQIGVGWVK